MDNKFLESLKDITNYKYTEKGAIAHKTSKNAVYDLFAFGGAYRKRSEDDCILLFKNAIEEDESLALKCLFYLRDIIEGQGERRFFRVCFKWLCDNRPEAAKRNLKYISEYGRWDDLLYATDGTKLEDYALFLVKEQLNLDLETKTPSLLGKWLPSENASSYKTRKLGGKVRRYLGMTHKEYRKVLSTLRERINIVERLMSENRWENIDFSKIPSRAGLIYKNAFARRDIIKQKYKNFIKNENTTVNTKTLYPYDIVGKATSMFDFWGDFNLDAAQDIDREVLEKYWSQLPNYFKDDNTSMLCVVDTSGSMQGTPMDIAISLGMYAAERAKGAFKNYYISFASRPQLIKIEGADFVDKVRRIYATNLCDNTNLTAVFDLIKNMVLTGKASQEDLPDRICVISDMEIDNAAYTYVEEDIWDINNAKTTMEKIRLEWAAAGLKLPRLIYWNVDARSNTILDLGPDISLVSGASATTFEMVMKDVTGWELCQEKLLSPRYECIK